MKKISAILFLSFLMSCSQGGGSKATPAPTPGPQDKDGDGVADVDDCSPEDASLFQNMIGFVDADQDGYRSSIETARCIGKTAPKDILPASAPIDCDDNEASRNTIIHLFADKDGDSFTEAASQALCIGGTTPPAGFFKKPSAIIDCNDNNTAVWQTQSIRRDQDGDGYAVGAAETACIGAEAPPHFILTEKAAPTDDCDDQESAQFRIASLFEDKDGDGYTAAQKSLCIGNKTPEGFRTEASRITDCDDQKAELFLTATYYVDNDQDTYGTGVSQIFCVAPDSKIPKGFVAQAGTDCDDNDAGKYVFLQNQFVDKDRDGYADSLQTVSLCTAPSPDYIANSKGLDCKINDPRAFKEYVLYPDADNDGLYSNQSVKVCAGETMPTPGYTADKPTDASTDPNDKDADCRVNIIAYADTDGDKFGHGDKIKVCAKSATQPPAGYSLNNSDCNDNDAKVYDSITGFLDEDGDLYTSSKEPQTFCVGSVSHVIKTSLGVDCNDHSADLQKNWTVYADNDGDGLTPSNTQFEICGAAGAVPAHYIVLNTPPTDNLDPDDSKAECQFMQNIYRDQDQDGYGSTEIARSCVVINYQLARDESLKSSDCDDQNSSIYQLMNAFIDQDGDGHGDAKKPVQICAGEKPTKGHSLVADDCDDANQQTFKTMVGYWDQDGDSYGTEAAARSYCVGDNSKVIASSFGLDCNDADANIFQIMTLYRDADGDKVIASLQTENICSGRNPPAGFTATASASIDPDDNNADCRVKVDGFVDQDKDTFGGEPITVCVKDAAQLPPRFSLKGGDCNDQNILIHETQEFYLDADGDGFPANKDVVVLCGARAGYVLRSLAEQKDIDSRDDDRLCSRALPAYADSDGDGIGAGPQVADACEAGTYKNGFAETGDDCAADDSTRFVIMDEYIDHDLDGEGDSKGTVQMICRGWDDPAGYASTNYDCDDNNNQAISMQSGYIDADGDRYGTGPLQSLCFDKRVHVTAFENRGQDCDDTNALLTNTVTFFEDNDGDGVGSSKSKNMCGGKNAPIPPGFSKQSTDCDDGNKDIFTSKTLFADNDGDTYTTQGIMVCMGSSTPQGYQLEAKGEDCDDKDPTKYLLLPLYYDADGDGVGQLKYQMHCASRDTNHLPKDFSTLGYDFKDNDPTFTDGGIDIELLLLQKQL